MEESNSSSDDTDSNSEDENRVVSTSELLQRSELIFPIIQDFIMHLLNATVSLYTLFLI